MKELMKKITVILVLMMMLINSSLLLIISDAIDAIEEVIDKAKINPLYEINLEKYVNYNTEGSTGTVVQINLKTGIEYGEGQEYKPLNSTGILLNLPKIEDEYPESIEVIGKSTKATNGSDEAKDFQQVYNKETGEMRLVAVNEADDNGNIYSENVEGARDEYTIICYYSSNCYNDKNDERNLEFSGFVQANIANDTEIKKNTEITQNYIVTENISGLVSTTVKTTDIYNGYINSNSQNGTNYATEYTENLEINISKKDLSDEVKIDTIHNFIDKNDKEIETDEIVYKSTRINKNEVLDILGEDGYLQILNEKGDVLGEVNKDTSVGENNIYELTYGNVLNKVIVKTSKPLKVGTIILQNIKEIKETMTDIQNSRIQVKCHISCINNIQEKDEETGKVIGEIQKEIYNFSDESVIDIKDSETRVDLSVDNQEWTNNMQNDVNFTATLVTNSPQYNLFKNPVIGIKLPSEVEKVVLGDATLLNSCNLSTDVNTELVEDGDNKIIKVQLTGIQTEYSTNGIYEGPYLVIPATIIMKKDMDSNYANIEYAYINESGTINDYTSEGKESKQLTIAEIAMNQVAVTSLEENLEDVALLSTSEQITEGIEVTLQAQVGNRVLNDGDSVYEKQVIKYTVTAKNTLGKNVSGINIVGKVPEGTTYATVDIGTYDEEKYEYIKDSSVTEYVLPITELAASQTKTEYYEVVVNDLDVETEKNIQNTINTKINNYQYSTQTISNTIKKAELNVQLISYIGRAEKSEFFYHIYVTNMTGESLTNINVETTEFPSVMKIKSFGDGSISTKYLDSEIIEVSDFEYTDKFEDNKYKATIESIGAGETIAIEIRVLVGNFEYGINEYELSMVATASSENTQTYESNENRRTAYPEYVTISQEVLDEKGNNIDGEVVNAKSEVTYMIHIKNESKIKTTINIQDYFNEKLENIEATCTTYELKEFSEEMAANETKYDLEQEANAEYDLVEQSISISNQKNEFNLITTIPAGKTLDITVKATVGEVQNYTSITNYFTVSGEYIKTLDSNITKFYVMPNYSDIDDPDDIYDFDEDDGKIDIKPEEPENPGEPENPENPGEPEKPENPGDSDATDDFNISGTVWIDKNKDGLRQEDEEKLSNVKVKLYNAITNSIEIDANNNKQIITTDEDGMYCFTSIKKGNYLVLFEYDNDIYTITKYQSSLANSTNNSDATQKEVSIDGVVETVAVTDILKINNESLENIDLGLIANKKLDLSLEKYVTKITVENASGTKEYKYNNSKLSKVEIPAKQLEGSIVTIEYKIVITNEGDTSAYVSEIIDYLPEGLSITNLDQNWIKDSNGNAIYSGLSGKEIQAGESKEVTLEVSKEINSDNIGTIVNYAEIGKISNLEGLKDIDSEEANKNPDEDDFSEATVIISIKTGLVRNIFIICVLLLSIALILYFVKTKNKQIILLAMICLVGLGVTNIVTAYTEVTDKTEYIINLVRYSNPKKFIDKNGNYYTCMDPGHPQCSHADHYYWMYGYDETLISSTTKDNLSGAKFNSAEFEKSGDYYYCKFESNKNFDGYIIEYSYVKNGEEHTNEIKYNVPNDKTMSSGRIKLDLPSDFESASATISLKYKGKIITTNKYSKTCYYYCYKLGEGVHYNNNCKVSDKDGSKGVQRMKRTIPRQEDEPKDKEISIKISTKNVSKGNIEIIKYDKSTGKLLNNIKFQVYYEDNGKKHYVDSGNNANVHFSDTEKTLTMGDNGTYIIKNVDLKHQYYFKEISSHNQLYIVPSSNVKLKNVEINKYNAILVSRAMGYFFSREKVNSIIVEQAEAGAAAFAKKNGIIDTTKEKEEYRRLIYKYIINSLGEKDDDLASGKNDFGAQGLYDWDCSSESKPTEAQVRKLISAYVNPFISDRIDSLVEKKSNIATKLENAINKGTLLYEYQKEVVVCYLSNRTPNLVPNTPNNGSLKIVKYDEDTEEKLKDAEFTIQYKGTVNGIKNPYLKSDGNFQQDKVTLTTSSSGTIQIDKIPVGTYEITEVTAPKEYKLNLQSSYNVNIKGVRDEIVVDNSSTKNKPNTIEFYNKKYGNLQIEKIDKNTGNTINSEGFGFIIYYYEDNNKNNGKKYIGTNCSVSDVNKVSELDIQTSDTKAKKFLTDATGKTQIIYNLPINVTYYIQEVEVPKSQQNYYELSSTAQKVNLHTNTTSTTIFKFENEQKYVDISGYVWEDRADTSKNTLRNNFYEAPETLVNGITVRLKDTNGKTIATTTTGSTGGTSEAGRYKFTKVKISELANYYVEFEYNGLKYQSVSKDLEKSNGSKATEKDDDRTNFNNLYAEITGANKKGTNTVGYSRNEPGKITNVLTYKNGTYGSSLIQNVGYNVSSANGSVTPQVYDGGGLSQGVTMRANTATAGYVLTWKEGITEITNVNLGIYERAQPDLAISTDIDNVELRINGYEDTCHYNERSEYINDLLPDDKDYKEKSAFSVDVKNKYNGEYKETTYTREIYDSYIAYTKSSDSNDSNRLRVYVTYKIVVQNESSLISKVSLMNYVDTRYESPKIIASKCYYNGDSKDVNWTWNEQESGKNVNVNVYETELIDQYIDSGSSMTIYVTYEVTEDGILYLLSKDETNPLKHTTEIKSYSTFDSNKNVYAGIDSDSAPDNIEYGNTNTYEDDTDSSPDLKLKRKKSKQISGLVFEDSTNAGNNLNTGGERIGNGAYTEGENVVENAGVELLNYSNNRIAKLYSIDSNGTDGIKIVDAHTITNSKGQYTLEGLVPGQYYIEYTYGTFKYNEENKTTVIKTTSGDVPVTTQNYKSTILDTKNYIAQNTFRDLFESSYDDIKTNFELIKTNFERNSASPNPSNALWYWYQNTNTSSAVDNWNIRQNINNKLSEINYGKENSYLSGNSTDLYTMKADTAIMDVAIEQYRGQQNESGSISDSDVYQVTFGIVERPRQSLEVTKEISHIKLTLANGQVLVEGDPRSDSLSYVTYPEGGSLKIEVDSEIIQGATLEVIYEIKIENKSELDYNTVKYYMYGDKTGASPVAMTINSVVDYMDKNLKTTYTYDVGEDNWKIVNPRKDLYDKDLISNDVYNNIKTNNNVLVKERNLVLAPGKYEKIEVSASKLLSTSKEMSYKNYVEVLTASNAVGRFYGQKDAESITMWKLISPGSLVTTDATTYEVDDNKVELNIIPPTGENQNIVIYIVIGISCLSLLVVGIVLIKKKVLD